MLFAAKYLYKCLNPSLTKLIFFQTVSSICFSLFKIKFSLGCSLFLIVNNSNPMNVFYHYSYIFYNHISVISDPVLVYWLIVLITSLAWYLAINLNGHNVYFECLKRNYRKLLYISGYLDFKWYVFFNFTIYFDVNLCFNPFFEYMKNW